MTRHSPEDILSYSQELLDNDPGLNCYPARMTILHNCYYAVFKFLNIEIASLFNEDLFDVSSRILDHGKLFSACNLIEQQDFSFAGKPPSPEIIEVAGLTKSLQNGRQDSDYYLSKCPEVSTVRSNLNNAKRVIEDLQTLKDRQVTQFQGFLLTSLCPKKRN